MKISKNYILFGAILILTILLLNQCNTTSNAKSELVIANMNSSVLLDSITTYKTKNNELVYTNGILIASGSDLKHLNSSLYQEIKNIKDNPKIIFRERIVIKNVPYEVATNSVYYPDSNTIISSWNLDTTFSKGNFQKLAGNTKVLFNNRDSVISSTTNITTNVIGLSLTTGLTEGKDHYNIFVKSNYPGFNVTTLEGSIIDKKIVETHESTIVFGPSIGYGLTFNNGIVNYGPYVGVNVTYNLNKSIKKLFNHGL